MFLPPDAPVSDFPSTSRFREQDWHRLAAFWHPVAFEHEIGNAPVAATLLDVDLVIYRTTDGIRVARDRCPHRGVRVSLGAIRDDRLVCPMHGMEFDSTGRAVRVPSVPDPNAPISPRLCLDMLRTELRYGIVWACLKPQPAWPLPQWPDISDAALRKVFVPVDEWHTSALRHTENFNDQAHFPFVHLGSFGSDDEVSTHDYQVQDTDYGIRFSYGYVEGGNRFPDGVEATERAVNYTYELTYPFSTLIIVDPQGSDFVHYFADAVSPVSVDRTRLFQQLTDTSGNPDPDYWVADSVKILEEDRPLVESQPALMPLHNGPESHHMPADRWSVHYRRALLERFGLGTATQEP